MKKAKSPNKDIDKVLKELLKDIATHPVEIRVKIIAQAISWEKVKNHIKDDSDQFDPDKL